VNTRRVKAHWLAQTCAGRAKKRELFHSARSLALQRATKEPANEAQFARSTGMSKFTVSFG
jgi:hypothetical protein